MISLRSLAILALALPFAAAASAPEAKHGSPPEGDHGDPAHAEPRSGPDCPRRLGNQDGAPRFADFPAPRAILAKDYVAPQLSSREIRAYRSTLGAEAANGPNFAANYTVAAWGCGFSCSAAAIVNLGNGRVIFPVELRRISTRHVRDWVSDRPLRYRGMRFNPGSRLLIVIGSAVGAETDESAVYYEWTGSGLRHLATIPRTQLCPA
ncbi:MAG TPA: hypothetical protein VEC11_11590 [Allosphingosinicella sp.]|nr:hypothetical protein [Allosphingosinicella sp.]